MTAASPIWRGYLADVDSRWNVIAGSVDDRTEEERGLKVSYLTFGQLAIHFIIFFLQPLNKNKCRIPKSRYDSVDLYISDHWMNRPEYNDSPLPYDEVIYDRLRAHGTLVKLYLI